MLNLQKKIKKYLKARKWNTLPPADLAKSISIEAAELLEHFQWCNPTQTDIKKDKVKFNEIQSEVADIVIYCLMMADRLCFDLERSSFKKLERISKKYPAKLFINSKAQPGSDLYWKIKNEYRNSQKNNDIISL